jgi:hypothetical protein
MYVLLGLISQDIYQNWLALTALSDERAAKLEEAEKKQQQLDQLRLQYAKQVAVSFFSVLWVSCHSLSFEHSHPDPTQLISARCNRL